MIDHGSSVVPEVPAHSFCASQVIHCHRFGSVFLDLDPTDLRGHDCGNAGRASLPGISQNLFIILLLLIVGGAVVRSALATRLNGPSAFFAHIELGNLLLKRGAREDALRGYSEALQHAPNDPVLRRSIEEQMKRVSTEPLDHIPD